MKKPTYEELEKKVLELERELKTYSDVSQEVMEGKQAEEKRREDQLRFLSTVTHEFKAPLTTIKSSIQLLEKNTDNWGDEKKAHYFQNVILSVNRMDELLVDVLKLEKYDLGKMEVNSQETNLDELCRDIVQEMELNFEGCKINYKNNHSTFIQIDPKIFRQIVVNLLTNAIKYSMQGNAVVDFFVECNDGRVVLTFQDYGIGIPEEEQKYIFEDFYRCENVKEKQGTGLGMSIVKRLLDLCKGSIEFSSQENVGTKFTVMIPYQ
ncbi:MAG: HAMP domain-containing histidine kinase [Leptospiraceae bacterium]|nr:HAMP domain-containing histidine kinase [Leptospiraceae bacterium]MCP5496698.1 HAMP domain-containing histidine kinase [Leptospiraceae bacterium]